MYPYWATANRPPYGYPQAANPYQTSNQNQSQSGNSSSANQTSEAQSSWQPYGQQPSYSSPFGQTQRPASTAGSGSGYDQLRYTSSNPYSTPSYPSTAIYSNPYSYGSNVSSGYYNQLPASPTPANNYPSSSSFSLFPKPSENATNTNSNLKTGIAASGTW
ncbi:hypothetical protein I204_01695 [Kwoniella mangroviensis CBS 8886]|nr:hypothetical protein I204_01695 [Kwoniella mangroviensis CBS 8886]